MWGSAIHTCTESWRQKTKRNGVSSSKTRCSLNNYLQLSCLFPVSPQYKFTFLHSITLLSLSVSFKELFQIRMQEWLNWFYDLSGKFLIKSPSASIEFCWVPHLGPIRFLSHVQGAMRSSHKSTLHQLRPDAIQLPALCFLELQDFLCQRKLF